jgi:DNA-directed RNA polymerase subunit RPC12/RpoP
MMNHLYEWAEDHGYVSYRCPQCGKTFWTDSDPRGECCQASADEEDDQTTDGKDDQACSDDNDQTADHEDHETIIVRDDSCPF